MSVLIHSGGSLVVWVVFQADLMVKRMVAMVVVVVGINLVLVHSSACCTGAVGGSSSSLSGNIASIHPGNPVNDS